MEWAFHEAVPSESIKDVKKQNSLMREKRVDSSKWYVRGVFLLKVGWFSDF
jgi:hypothetical protein